LTNAAGVLQDYNGSYQRWKDVAENTYTEPYQTAFDYGQANATVTYEQTNWTFKGTFNATGLKPNFAYQLKLVGKPDEDPLSDQRLREIGRSFDIALNMSVGYVIFDYVVTDQNGTSYKEFSLANSYHVLWKVSQRTPQPNDSTPTWYQVQGSPSDPPHAYGTPIGPASIGVYAEWEKGVPGNVRPPTGNYNVKFIITEESFHSPKGDPTGGYWSTVMGCDVNFTIGARVPDDFATIQAAINNATEGDTIFVSSGTYHENVAVNKTVSLIGKDKDSTILNRTTIEPIMIVEANDVKISGFTFEGWAFQDILINATTGVTIVENKIVFNAVGIDVENSVNTTIENNIINGFGLDNIGIMLAYSSGCSIVNNTITNAVYDGIRLWFSNSNLIYQNLIKDNDYGIFFHEANLNTISENTISESGGPGISIDSSSSNEILHNSFINNYHQAMIYDNSVNTWDDGYPAGGNYWGDYAGSDLHTGMYQNDTGKDGIGDSPYPVADFNSDSFPLMKPYAGSHDIGIAEARASKTIVGQAYGTNITVSMVNYGQQEIFNVTIEVNGTAIRTQSVTLSERNSTDIFAVWNTTDWAKGNYTLVAYAGPVWGETCETDNTWFSLWIFVSLPGDIDSDKYVNAKDAVILGTAFGSSFGDVAWVSNADIDDDSWVNAKDAIILGAFFNQNWL